jgi:cellulose synthase/poly-beta-1,6-N-acetylglucosamine synthase-like glycosyltransferase
MTIIILFTLALLVGYAVLLGYYRSAWQSLPSWSGTAITGSTRVTIIIPARNEAANILPCLHSILAQAYPAHLLEVIVADDFSTDDTAALTLSVKHPSLRLLRLSDHVTTPINAYKKKAIELAIAQSSGQLILTTDADCIVPPHWLTTIVSFYETHQPAFIAAPVVFGSRPGALALFQSLDFMTLQGITGAAVHRRFHAMCNGANLAYERSAFESVGGFAGINHIASGDDMLLMHKIGTRYPDRVLFLKSPDVIVTTAPAPTLRAFLQQRIRWASKADKYEDKRIFGVLLLVYLLNVLFLVLPILAWFTPCPGRGVLIWLGLLSGKTLAELYFLFPVARFFSKTHWLWWFAPAQPFHILYTVVAGWLGKFGRYEWKQRQVQ